MMPLYFSRLLLKGGLRDLHDVHEAVWRGFSAELPDDAERPFLFRADRVLVDERTRAWKVLVQATRSADWSRVDDSLIEQTQTDARPQVFVVGERLRFFVRANATKSKKGRSEHRFAELENEDFQKARGFRVPVLGEEELRGWLRRVAGRGGWDVVAVRIVGQRRESWRDGGRSAVHVGTDFEGHLSVVDPERLALMVAAGIGCAKAFGFGLLSLAREQG